jgi:hypothetical protein
MIDNRYNAFARSPQGRAFIIAFDTTYDNAVAHCEQVCQSPYNDWGIEKVNRAGDVWYANTLPIAHIAPFSVDLQGHHAYSKDFTRLKARRLEALGVRVQLNGRYHGEPPLTDEQKANLERIRQDAVKMCDYAQHTSLELYPYEPLPFQQLIEQIQAAILQLNGSVKAVEF